MDEPDFLVQRIMATDGSVHVAVDGTDYGGHGHDTWWLHHDPVLKTFSFRRSGGITWGGTWESDHNWEAGLAQLSDAGRERALRQREILESDREAS